MKKMRLQYGMVGGGNGGNIGGAHRRGAMMDSLAVLTAGAFTRNPEQNKRDGETWGVPADRIYDTWRQMAEAEGAREDGIDFVTIVTPNHTHYEIAKAFLENGINVVCEKPFTMTSAEGEELCALAKARGLEICVTYTYPHYPILQEARHLIASGALGKIRNIWAEYPQDWLLLDMNDPEKNGSLWFVDPTKSGISNVTSSITVHLNYLITSMTGLKPERVLADFDCYPDGAPLDTTSHVLARYTGNVHAALLCSFTAIGRDCSIGLKIFGEKGTVEWYHDDPTHLRVAFLNKPVEIRTCRQKYLCREAYEMSRLPAGHPEGFYEAFGNIYHSFCTLLLNKANGETGKQTYFHPTGEDGVMGIRLVEACVKSNRNGNIWVDV